jgi:quercetin 2,3-dioxygenase
LIKNNFMKTVLHKANERGHANHGWLDAWHSFSFASYYDPAKIHFGAIRVLNDDTIAGGMGFGTHPHDNMEIITIPMSGQLEHKDSMGNTGIISKGEVQVMSAGRGIQHSEYNHNANEEVKLFQIWLFPNQKNVTPRYDQRAFHFDGVKNSFITLVSPMGNDEGLNIHQNAWISYGKLDAGTSNTYYIKAKGNGVYIMLVNGEAAIGETILHKRDAIGITEADMIDIKANVGSEILLLEVPV